MDMVQCKACSQTGHFAKDCPSQVSACPVLGHDYVTDSSEECRNCRQFGHHSRDCVNERVMVCRNCDNVGHMSK